MKKKLLALGMTLAMGCMMLTGCGEDGTTTTTTTTKTESTAEGTTEETAEVTTEVTTETSAHGEMTQAIVDRGVLKVGVKNAVLGFGFQDTLTGEYSGMEISIAEKIAESLGVDIEFTTVTAATRTELLDSGDIDCVLATFTITDERKESWDFSTPYYTDYVTVLVEDASGITNLSGLVDGCVGVSSGSTSAKALTKAMIDAGLIDGTDFDPDTFDPATWSTGISYKQYEDYPGISTALAAGEVDAFCVDKSILAVYNTEGRSYIEDKFSPQDYGVATKKGSDFSAYVEELITAWLADGTISGFIAENGLD